MSRVFHHKTGYKLRLAAWMSSLWLLSALAATAHEVTPAIADLTVTDGEARLDLRLNAEAYLAGIDLDALADTDDTDQSDQYDALRALTPDQMQTQITSFFDSWAGRQMIHADGAPLLLDLTNVSVPEVGDIDLPRTTILQMQTQVPQVRSIEVHWPIGAGALVLRQQGVDDPYTGYINGGTSSGPITLQGGGALGPWDTFVSYIPVGFDHILPKGLDHILFVLGLFFLSTRVAPLLWQISAFTLAHTVTLALGALGLVTVPASIVEPLIAASIVYVAVENLFHDRLSRWRPLVIFGFGLLHGLGFASVLGEFGLPQQQFIPALVGFNIGVELGQLAVIAAAFFAVGLWFGKTRWYRPVIAIPASLIIACIGAYWVVERVVLT